MQALSVKQHMWPRFSVTFLLVLGFLLVYILGISPYPVAYADSDELLSVGYFLGVAHPPGYPLYILLLHLFLHAPLPATIAFKGHLLSAVCGAIGVGMVFAASHLLYNTLRHKSAKATLFSPRVDAYMLAVITSFTLGFSYLYWLYSQITEKYSLSVLLTGIYSMLILRLVTHKRFSAPIFSLLCLVFGLALSHHQALVFLLPSFLYASYVHYKHITFRVGVISVALFVVGLAVPFLLMYLFSLRNPTISWQMHPTFEGLWKHVTRQAFSGEIPERGVEVHAYFNALDLRASATAVFAYIQMLGRYFHWWLVVPLLLGLRFGFQKHKTAFVTLVLMAVFLGPVIAGLVRWPSDPGSQAVLQRQFIPGMIPVALLTWFGWHELWSRFSTALPLIMNKKRARALLVAVPAVSFLAQIAFTWNDVNRSDFSLPFQRYNWTLTHAEPGSLLTCYSDTACFSLLYQQYVLGINPDVTVVPLQFPLVSNAYEIDALKRFTYQDNPYMIWDIVTWNLDKRPVYAVDLDQYYYQFFGFDYPFMYYVPHEHLGRLTKSLPGTISEPTFPFADELSKEAHPTRDLMKKWLVLHFTQRNILNSVQYLKMDARKFAQLELNQAANIHFRYGAQEEAFITATRNEFEQLQAREVYALGASVDDSQTFLDYIPGLIENGYNQRAYIAAHGAVAVDPTNVAARLTLAQMFEKIGDFAFASREYDHVLLLHPENDIAKERLAILNPEL